MSVRKNSKGADIDKLIKDGKKTRFNGETAAKAGRKSQEVQKRNLCVKSIAEKILNATSKTAEQLKDQIAGLGIDTQDAEMMTNASLILIKLMQQASNGDQNAIKMLFEMAGQTVDAKTALDRQRLELERERLQLERERAALAESTEESTTIVIRRKRDGD